MHYYEMRILEKLATFFELKANPRPHIIPPHVDLGYQKRVNNDGSIGGIVHSFAIVPEHVYVEPDSQIDPFVEIESGRVPKGILLTIENNKVVEKPLNFTPP